MKYKITRQYLDNFDCDKKELKNIDYMDTTDESFTKHGFIIKYTYYYKNNSVKITLISITSFEKVKQNEVISKINELFSLNNPINIPLELNYKTLSSYIYYNTGKQFGVNLFRTKILKLKNKNNDKICFIEFGNNSFIKEPKLYVYGSKGTEEIQPLLFYLLESKKLYQDYDHLNLGIYNLKNNIFSGSDKLETPIYFTELK